MEINKKEFIANLDSVLELFRHLKEKLVDGNSSVDHTFIRNFNEIIKNYRIIREEIPEEMVSKFGMPIQVMALQLIEQLRQELEMKNKNTHDRSAEQKIDELLLNPGLTDIEINELLDQRLMVRKEE